MGPRHAFVDNLKAIAIVLVVLGHAPAMPDAVRELIFGCHVPLFFFAAGFLAAGGAARAPGEQARGALRRFVVPYAAFFLISYAYWLATRDYGNSAARYAGLPWWDPWVDFLLGYGSYVNPTLWFFPCIAATTLLHRALRSRLDRVGLLAACVVPAALVVLLWPQAGPLVPWRLDTALVALAFYGVGFHCHGKGLSRRAAHPPSLWWAAVPGVPYLWLALANPGADLALMRFGAVPALYLPVAALGIAATAIISMNFAGNGLTRWLSANTLYIFPLHWLMFRFFTGVGIVLLELPRDFKDQSWLIGLAYAAAALLLCIPASAWLRRWPLLTGAAAARPRSP